MLKDRVKALCTERGITIQKLEEEAGIGNATITRWDKVSPKADSLEKVANYFGVSVDYLLGRTELKNEEEIKEELRNLKIDFQLFGDKAPEQIDQKYIERALELFAQMSDEEKEKAIHQIEMVLAYSRMQKQ